MENSFLVEFLRDGDEAARILDPFELLTTRCIIKKYTLKVKLYTVQCTEWGKVLFVCQVALVVWLKTLDSRESPP